VIGVLLLIVAVAVLGAFIPIYWSRLSFCPYCRTWMMQQRVFLVWLPTEIQEGEMARYWRQEVEPHHVHNWALHHSNELHTLSGIHGDAFRNRLILGLPERAEIAILRSLPTAAARKALVQRVWLGGRSRNPRARQAVENALADLNRAYESNPDRKDWPELLKKYHLWP
jgi:hypothetical protein